MKKYQSIPNIACLVAACNDLAIPYKFFDDNHNLVKVSLDRDYYFANSSTPLNDEAISKICKDKEFMYKVMNKVIPMPKTLGFLDPDCNPDYLPYLTFTTHKEILEQIENEFSYPLILKKNSGSRGVNVFKCDDSDSVRESLSTIYDKRSLYYDYVAVAQAYINIQREFRVIVLQGQVVLVYEKDFSHAKSVDGNISPLHRENSRAVLVTDDTLIKRLSKFIWPLFNEITIGFAGLDIVIDDKGSLWMIELNTKPGFDYFVRDNGQSELIKVYKLILENLLKKIN